MDSSFRDSLIYLLQTTGELEGRADDVADAIITGFRFREDRYWHSVAGGVTCHAIIGWMPEEKS